MTGIDFPEVHSGQQAFSSEGEHFSAEVSGRELLHQDFRPVVYVNTWNHMMSNADYNPQSKKTTFSNFEVREGSRYQANREEAWRSFLIPPYNHEVPAPDRQTASAQPPT